MNIWHCCLELRVYVMALLFYNTTPVNGWFEAIIIELLFINIFNFCPMWKEKLHISNRYFFHSLKVAHISVVFKLNEIIEQLIIYVFNPH